MKICLDSRFRWLVIAILFMIFRLISIASQQLLSSFPACCMRGIYIVFIWNIKPTGLIVPSLSMSYNLFPLTYININIRWKGSTNSWTIRWWKFIALPLNQIFFFFESTHHYWLESPYWLAGTWQISQGTRR